MSNLLISIETAPASDSWGFVGRVMVGMHEAYRTIEAYPTPGEALEATQQILGNALGTLLAGEEWRSLGDRVGHAPLRRDLQLGLGRLSDRPTVDVRREAPTDSRTDPPA